MEDEGQSSERQASQSQRSSAASLQAEEARLPGMFLCAMHACMHVYYY